MFLYEPKMGDVIIDIGAGSGIDVLEFSRRVGSNGKVIAVEAHPGSFQLLRKLCERNALTNVVCRQRAVMDKHGVTRISGNPGCEANTMAHGRTGADNGFEVLGVTVDELVEEFGLARVDFLKMNIEGAERLAIRGMSGTVIRTGHVCIACHDFRAAEDDWYRTKTSVEEFLRRHGMHPICRDDHEKPWVRDHVHAAGLP
jgi:FkbM family methyltransferase